MTNNEVDALAEVLSDYMKCGRCPVCDEGFCDGVDHGIENCKNAFVVWIWDTLGETYPNQDRSEERKSIFMNDYLKLMDRIYSAAFDDGYKANKSNSYNEAYDKGFEESKEDKTPKDEYIKGYINAIMSMNEKGYKMVHTCSTCKYYTHVVLTGGRTMNSYYCSLVRTINVCSDDFCSKWVKRKEEE